jgi:hypothetical protein
MLSQPKKVLLKSAVCSLAAVFALNLPPVWSQSLVLASNSPPEAAANALSPASSASVAGMAAGKKPFLLKGRVTTKQTPLLEGAPVTLPKGEKVNLTLECNLNSEISQLGDQILARVSCDLKDGRKVLLPGGWYVHGKVTEVGSQRRLGRDGYVEVEFDKLITPDKTIELPFPAKFSTKDNQLKAISKVVAIDSGYVAEGAAAGAILSAQLTGIPIAIATHGLSLAVGAAAGATLGLGGALARKGKIASVYPGDQVKLTIAEPIELPGFDPSMLPSAKPQAKLKDFDLIIKKAKYHKDPFGDSHSRLITLDIAMNNHTDNEYSFFDLVVVADNDEHYYPMPQGDLHVFARKVKPNASAEATISFIVSKKSEKYWLVLLDKVKGEELTRVEIR